MATTLRNALLMLLPTVLPMGTALAAGDAARGETLYQAYCARCHGPEADGNGRMAVLYRRLAAPKPSNFTVDYFAGRPEAYLRKIILEGGERHGRSKYMPPFQGELGEQQVADLIAFIRQKALED